jgi:hypothetical protein
MSVIKTNYGLHNDNGVWYLHQGRKQVMNFISLSRPSPFDIQNLGGKKVACPHLINGSTPMPDRVQWDLFMEMIRDPLVEFFLPVPRKLEDLVPYVSDPNNDLVMYLVLLSRLSSPIYPVVHQCQNITMPRIRDELALTNVCPLVVTGFKTEDQAVVEQLAREARRSPRRLIMAGDPMIVVRPPLVQLQTFIQDFDEVTLHSTAMENLGAVALRRFARGEQIDAPWTKRSGDEEVD